MNFIFGKQNESSTASPLNAVVLIIHEYLKSYFLTASFRKLKYFLTTTSISLVTEQWQEPQPCECLILKQILMNSACFFYLGSMTLQVCLLQTLPFKHM